MHFLNLIALQLLFVDTIANTLEPQVRHGTESIPSEDQTKYYGKINNFANYARLPRIGFHGFRMYNAIQKQLASLILQLRTYMSEDNLTENEKMMYARSLHEEIDTVTNLATETNLLRSLDDQIRLIKHVYHVAADTDHLIEYFSLTDQVQHLLYSFVHLNLELLNLHNNNGVPVTGTYDCRSRVTATIGSFINWESAMGKLINMPVSLRKLLENRFTDAKYLLGVAEAAVLKYD